MHLSALYRYPLKSGRGQALDESFVQPQGLPYDRAFMLVDPEGQMITGRTEPRLVLLETHLDPEAFQVSGPDLPALRCPLKAAVESIQCTVWRDTFTAITGWHAADAALSAWLGRPVRLCFSGRPSARRVRDWPETELGFADALPLLLIGEASLADLNGRLARPVRMARFRPNLVVAGAPALAEDEWKRIRIGEVCLRLVKACERCVFTTVDPESGEKSRFQEPLRTLATYRATPAGVLFGQNLIAENAGRLALGMPVEILE